MNYYIALLTNEKNKITVFHLVDYNNKKIYHGIFKIKNSFRNGINFNPNAKTYHHIFEINEKLFLKMLELPLSYFEKLHIKKFCKQYSLEEFII